MEYLLAGFGGIFGSIARYGLDKAVSSRAKSGFPWGTFMINLSGALALGIFTGWKLSGNAFSLLCSGFLGAYTTFSTFMFEGFTLFRNKKRLNAVVYIAGSFVLGLLGFAAGLAVGRAAR